MEVLPPVGAGTGTGAPVPGTPPVGALVGATVGAVVGAVVGLQKSVSLSIDLVSSQTYQELHSVTVEEVIVRVMVQGSVKVRVPGAVMV